MEKIQPIPTRECLVDSKTLAATGDVIARHAPNARRWLLVCDDTTWEAAGEKTATLLGGRRYLATPFSLGQNVRPLASHATDIAPMMDEQDGLIAIGSGTINDITKHAASLSNKPYLCVATAASMNGYVSASASLESGNMKQSHPSDPPLALIADLEIIAASPHRMTRAGIGDTLCRSSVEADMLLSHHLLETDYPSALFETLRRHEPNILMHASQLRDHEPAALKILMEALIDAGNAMTTHGTSAPASQGEHMIAHTIEMLYPAEVKHTLHGELIAVTTLTMGKLQEEILEGQPFVKPMPCEDVIFQRLFGKDAGFSLIEQYRRKQLSEQRAFLVNTKIERNWPMIRESIQRIMLPADSLKRAFVQAALPSTPRDLKIKREHYATACRHAHQTRDRFTFLDLAAMMGKETWEN